MDRATNTLTRRIDGAIDAAQFARHPIYYFDLAPILERSGSAYIRNPERLQVICENGLGHLSESDMTLFDETGFYLIVGSCDGAQAEGLANRISVALLKLFFGTESLAPDQLVPLFRKASPGEISQGASALAQRAAAIMHPPSDRATRAPGTPGAKSDDGSARDQFDQLASQGVYEPDRLSLCFMPAYDLKRGTPALFFCLPTTVDNGQIVQGHRAFASVAAQDMPFADEAILRHAVQFADRLLEGGNLIAVTAPISVETMSWSRGRSTYQSALRRIGIEGHPQVIPLIDDIAPGTPPSRIAEMLAALRPFARRVAIALPDCEVALENSGLLGAAGIIVAMPRRADTGTASRTASWLARACATQNAFSCITSINSEEALEAVKEAGIRFGAGTALAPPALTGEDAIEYARLLTRLPPLPAPS